MDTPLGRSTKQEYFKSKRILNSQDWFKSYGDISDRGVDFSYWWCMPWVEDNNYMNTPYPKRGGHKGLKMARHWRAANLGLQFILIPTPGFGWGLYFGPLGLWDVKGKYLEKGFDSLFLSLHQTQPRGWSTKSVIIHSFIQLIIFISFSLKHWIFKKVKSYIFRSCVENLPNLKQFKIPMIGLNVCRCIVLNGKWVYYQLGYPV